MPFISGGGVTVIVNNNIGDQYPDVSPEDGIVDEANRITLDGVTVEPQEVKQAEADIIDLDLTKMDKTDPVDGGGF
jgi:hypothetical protein